MTASRDIVVVGAGVIGCAIAYELARRGASVEVIDDRPPGMGATQAAAGVLAPYIEARDGGALLDLTARSLELFDRFVERLRDESGCAITYQRTGTLDAATQPDHLGRLAGTHDILVALGIESTLLDRAAVHGREPQLTDAVVGGLLIPLHGFVAAGELTRALARAACRHGARFIQQGRVRAVRRSNGDLAVDMDHGAVQAHAVIVASGSWAADIEIQGARQRVPVGPIRGQLVQLVWSAPPLARVIWGDRCYLVPWHDGTVLVGATVENAGFDERATVAGVRELIEAACDLVPAAHTAGFVAARVGLRPGTPDHLPIIGASSVLPGVFFATGHYRNGILLAPLTAELVSKAVLDGQLDPMLEWIRPQRFGEL